MEFLNPYSIVEIPLLELMRNLAIGVMLAVIHAWVASKSTRLVVDTGQYLPLFLVLIPTTILIITVIKTSIALSLGLVGALSIIRFRTPIKDPEELTYIFLAIAIGLGLGANQVLVTIIGFSVVTLVSVPSIIKRTTVSRSYSNYIDIVLRSTKEDKIDMTEFISLLDESLKRYRIKRVTETDGRHEVTLELADLNMTNYERLKDQLSRRYEIVEISIIDNARVIT